MPTPVTQQQVFDLLKTISPGATGFRWDMHFNYDAADSYGTLFVRHGRDTEKSTKDFERGSLARSIMEALENVLYGAGWASVTI